MSVVMKSTGGLVRESGVGRMGSWRWERVKVLFVCMMRLSVEWSVEGINRQRVARGHQPKAPAGWSKPRRQGPDPEQSLAPMAPAAQLHVTEH